MSQRYDFPCMCAMVESFFYYEYPHFLFKRNGKCEYVVRKCRNA